MKNTIRGVVAAVIILASAMQSFAVVDQAIQVDGTNLVLSWPSQGYEHYLIQYRPNLGPSTLWTDLTNNYPANSTNRTTYIIPCCTLAEFGGGESFSGGGASGASLTANDSGKSDDSDDWNWWAMPKDGSGDAVPLALYPDGFDTGGLVLVEPPKPEAEGESKLQSSAVFGGSGGNGPLNLTSGGCDCPDMGFFRVFHIPDWTFNVTNYTYDGPTFFPVDFADYVDKVDNIEVLLNDQPTEYAEFTSIVDQGQTYWGMGIYFDRIASGTYQIQLRSTLLLNEIVGEDSQYLVLSNRSAAIVVNNQVTFTNWDDLIVGTNAVFRAQTKTNNTDWQIDIYDAFGGYVNGASGHTTNGQIAWTWDLKDTTGTMRDSLEDDPFFDPYITFAVAGTAQQTTRPSRNSS